MEESFHSVLRCTELGGGPKHTLMLPHFFICCLVIAGGEEQSPLATNNEHGEQQTLD